jgi:putative nucleotidyltransferase with HDIG domain
MKEHTKQNTVDYVKRNLQIMHLTILLSVVVTFVIVARFLYGYLAYLPLLSVMVFLASLAVMSGAVFGLSKVTTQKAMEALEVYGERLNAFLATSRDVHEIAHSDLLTEKILDAAVALTGADGGAMLLADDDELEFRCVSGAAAGSLQGRRIQRSRSIVGAVIAQGMPIRIDDMEKAGRCFVNAENGSGHAARSILCVPLVVDGKITGALELVHSRPGYFTADDEDMLKYFAEQATIAARNSAFREDMRNLESHLTALLVDVNEKKTGRREHARMTARYSLMIGREAGLSEAELQNLYRAALLHDIGLLRMDLSASKTEWEYYAHAVHGYEILRNVSFYRDIASIVLHHHERYDGTGYPNGLKGEMIPLASRIIALAEGFDAINNSGNGAMTRSPDAIEMTAKGAIIELRAAAGKYYDPQLTDLFISTILRESAGEPAAGSCADRCALLQTA